MSLLLLVTILFAGSVVSQVQVPCYGENCVNITVYLGPRWGSRVVMVPRTNKTTTTRPEVTTTRNEVEISGDRYDQQDDKYRRPQHRPVPNNGESQIDFTDDESSFKTTRIPYKSNIRWPWWIPSTTRRPWLIPSTTRRPPNSDKEVRVVMDKFGRGTVDLSWRGYSGEGVKHALMSLSVADRKQVTKLILDNNMIETLPVLVFPVELEYGLQELSLNGNPFNAPYLNSYTRFELSRLGNLKTLNISQCGLSYIEMPDIPSLEVLDLSYNELTYLPLSMGRLTNLQQLFLRGNKLSYISTTPFSTLTGLWVLDLGENHIQEFWGEPLENLYNLVTLKLDNNLLWRLPQLSEERTKIVFLANNSLVCSCDLVEWLGRPSIQLRDDYSESCQDTHRTIPIYELRTWPERDHGLCNNGWWGERAWAALTLWYRRNPDIMRIIYKVVGVTFVLVVLAIVLRRQRRVVNKVKPSGSDIPYEFLDDQQVSTVSGPHLHA